MLIYVFGATASGKSEIAEDMACAAGGERIYLATMEKQSEESEERIKKHRKMRCGKGFVTVEQSRSLIELNLSGKVILLECMSNLLANTMFEGDTVHDVEYCVKTVMEDIWHLQRQNDLIAVGNDVFGEDVFSGKEYDGMTKNYIRALKEIHENMMRQSNRCVEVVCKIAIERK